MFQHLAPYGLGDNHFRKIPQEIEALQFIQMNDRPRVTDNNLACPSRKDAAIRSIWIIDKGGERPRLVSAYPL